MDKKTIASDIVSNAAQSSSPGRSPDNGPVTQSSPRSGSQSDETENKEIVEPRDAASLLIYRTSGEHPEVLLGRRPKGSRFMPDVFVYPGGAVDPEDEKVEAASELAPAIVTQLQPSCSASTPRTLALTAIRETFEETGLTLASEGDPGPVEDVSWQNFRDRGLAPTLAPLRYIGRAITPPYRPRRFHARFFAVSMEHLRGHIAATDELIELDWFPAKRTGDLPMADVTRYMLEQLLEMLDSDQQWLGNGVFTHKDGRRHVELDIS